MCTAAYTYTCTQTYIQIHKYTEKKCQMKFHTNTLRCNYSYVKQNKGKIQHKQGFQIQAESFQDIGLKKKKKIGIVKANNIKKENCIQG